jgi:hypothetical protein
MRGERLPSQARHLEYWLDAARVFASRRPSDTSGASRSFAIAHAPTGGARGPSPGSRVFVGRSVPHPRDSEFDLSNTRKEVRREMSAETEEPAETTEETAEAPAVEEPAARRPRRRGAEKAAATSGQGSPRRGAGSESQAAPELDPSSRHERQVSEGGGSAVWSGARGWRRRSAYQASKRPWGEAR